MHNQLGESLPRIPTNGALASAFINDTTFAESLRSSSDRRAMAIRIHSMPFILAASSMEGNIKFDCNRPIDCNSDFTNDKAKSLSENSLINTRRSRPCDDRLPPTVPTNSPRNIRTIDPLLVRVRRGLYAKQEAVLN